MNTFWYQVYSLVGYSGPAVVFTVILLVRLVRRWVFMRYMKSMGEAFRSDDE